MIREGFHDGSCGALLTPDLVPLSSALGLKVSRGDPGAQRVIPWLVWQEDTHLLQTHSLVQTVQGLNTKVQPGASVVASLLEHAEDSFLTWKPLLLIFQPPLKGQL